jgi:hypothetical protein
MNETLSELLQQREQRLAEIQQLGDFRPGSITPTRGTCGKPGCHCHRRGDVGHGPNFRLTYKVGGKTRTETFATPEAQRKAEREVNAFRQFQKLTRDLIELNEKICRLRPVAAEDSRSQEKKRSKPFIKKSAAR